MKTIDITLASPAVALAVENALTDFLRSDQAVDIGVSDDEFDAVVAVRDAIRTARERATFARHPLADFVPEEQLTYGLARKPGDRR